MMPRPMSTPSAQFSLTIRLAIANRPGALGQDLYEHRREAEDRVRRLPRRGRDRLRQRVERAVRKAVPVDQE